MATKRCRALLCLCAGRALTEEAPAFVDALDATVDILKYGSGRSQQVSPVPAVAQQPMAKGRVPPAPAWRAVCFSLSKVDAARSLDGAGCGVVGVRGSRRRRWRS